MTVKYVLADASGSTLWDDTYRVTPLSSPVEATSLEDIKANPAVLADMWRKAAAAVAKKAFSAQSAAQ